MKKDKIYDIIGIGIGPFNLGLAALAEPVDELAVLFFDQAPAFNWHPGMMLSEATLQVPFMADLVSMADPTSKFSFLNFLKQTGRLYQFYIRENFFILRKEYNAYCKWAIAQLPSCRFSQKVLSTAYNEQTGCYELVVEDQHDLSTRLFVTRRLVLGTGTVPKIPDVEHDGLQNNVFHSSAYLDHKARMMEGKRVSIIGSGQSAAEIFNDLLPHTETGMCLSWFTRPDRFFPMEYAKLTLELTSPEYVDHFFNLPREKRKQVLGRQNPLFKGINYSLINQIFDKLYELSVDNAGVHAQLSPNCQLNAIKSCNDGSYLLYFYHTELEQEFTQEADFVVMATGYQYKEPAFLRGIQHRILRDAEHLYAVARNYTIDQNHAEIFVQNAELHTHGFVTPDLGMGAYRNSCIINTLLNRTVYTVEKKIAFQQFGLNREPDEAEPAGVTGESEESKYLTFTT